MTEKEYEQEIMFLRDTLKYTKDATTAYIKAFNLLYKHATEEEKKQIEEYLKDV